VCRSKHVEPSINFRMINSITKLDLVGISSESSMMGGSTNIMCVQFSVGVEIQLFEVGAYRPYSFRFLSVWTDEKRSPQKKNVNTRENLSLAL